MKPNTKKEIPFSGSSLTAALEEGVGLLRAGKIGDLRHTTIELPAPAKALPPQKIRAIRTQLGASQAVFALLLNVPRTTAIAWESGTRKPSGAALKLLYIAQKRPDVLLAA